MVKKISELSPYSGTPDGNEEVVVNASGTTYRGKLNVLLTWLLSPITTLGDLVVGNGAGKAARLAVGANGKVLTVVSGAPAWADPTGGGGGSATLTSTQIGFGSGSNVLTGDASLTYVQDNTSFLSKILFSGTRAGAMVGADSTTANANSLMLQAGGYTGSSTFDAGSVILFSGNNSGSGSGSAGNTSIYGGNNTDGTGPAGVVQIVGGSTLGTNNSTAGDVYLFGGDKANGGTAGGINISGGTSSSSSVAGAGGPVSISTGKVNFGTNAAAITFKTASGTGSPVTRMTITAGGTVQVAGQLSVSGAAFTTPSTVAFSATPTFDASASNVFYFGTMTGNVTSSTISNPVDGQTIQIRAVQDATGGRSFVLPANVKADVTAYVSLANRVNHLTLTYIGPASRWEGQWTAIPA